MQLPIDARSEKIAIALFYQVMPKSCVKIIKIKEVETKSK